MVNFDGNFECHIHSFKILFPLLKNINSSRDGKKEMTVHSIDLPLLFHFLSFVPSLTMAAGGWTFDYLSEQQDQ
jgi:hypothetical protein